MTNRSVTAYIVTSSITFLTSLSGHAGMIQRDLTQYTASVTLDTNNPYIRISGRTLEWAGAVHDVNGDSFMQVPSNWAGTSNIPVRGFITRLASPLLLAPGTNPLLSDNTVNNLYLLHTGHAVYGTASSTTTRLPIRFAVPAGTPDGVYNGSFCLTLVATRNTADDKWLTTCYSNYGTVISFSYRVMGGAVVPPDTPTSCSISAMPPIYLGSLAVNAAVGKAPSTAATISCSGDTKATLTFSGCSMGGDGNCVTDLGLGASGRLTAHANGGGAYKPGTTMSLNNGANTFTIKTDFITAVPTVPGTIRKNVVISIKYE